MIFEGGTYVERRAVDTRTEEHLTSEEKMIGGLAKNEAPASSIAMTAVLTDEVLRLRAHTLASPTRVAEITFWICDPPSPGLNE